MCHVFDMRAMREGSMSGSFTKLRPGGNIEHHLLKRHEWHIQVSMSIGKKALYLYEEYAMLEAYVVSD